MLDRKESRAIVTDVLLRPGERLESKHFQRVKIFKKASSNLAFDTLIGPYPYMGAMIPDAVAWFVHSEPRLHLAAGWVYAAGECPYVEEELVDATAGGSNATIIMLINNVSHDVYIFLLRKTGSEWAKVTVRADPSNYKEWNFRSPYDNRERYVIFHPPATLDDPQTLSGPLQSFVSDVMGFAADAGVLDADR